MLQKPVSVRRNRIAHRNTIQGRVDHSAVARLGPFWEGMPVILSTSNVVDYLLESGLVTSRVVVDGNFMVIDASSRNRNYKIMRGHPPGLFVKQVKRWDLDTIATLDRDAACYWLAVHDPGFAALQRFLPAHVHFDPDHHILITDLVAGENLHQYYRRVGKFPVFVAANLAGLLAAIHSSVRETVSRPPFHPGFPRKSPWMLSIHTYDPPMIQRLSGGVARLLEAVRETDVFHPALDALSAGWRTDSFIHGDLRWDNVLVNSYADPIELKLIDWEMAGFGDALWDVGGVFFAYLSSWVSSIPTDKVLADELVQAAEHPLHTIQPAMGVFWRAYARQTGMPASGADEALLLSMRYAAVRMLQSAYEQVVQAPDLTPHAVLMLQLSANVLSNPEGAVADLMGIRDVRA